MQITWEGGTGANTKRVRGANAPVSLIIWKLSASLNHGMRENRITCAKQDGCETVHSDVHLGWTTRVRWTRRASVW
ncbi:hypothetical protein TPL01_12380 [Sulfuriferula plumbiphila]|uniref:Uncharacterized protein n=1 Tax=Sulfuriferula plumbiphila TaxID=171865 RepID=A0A512L6J0_9PROT|nr:hypothetical protein SFPGR_22490 [Sulfuriferula plumbiphila]GEP30100.1 hypothetical protein TPL01_12380 [Sulfuriferula plumbiphila]